MENRGLQNHTVGREPAAAVTGASSVKRRRLMRSFTISLQRHKEDKHLVSKNTPFSDDEEEKIR